MISVGMIPLSAMLLEVEKRDVRLFLSYTKQYRHTMFISMPKIYIQTESAVIASEAMLYVVHI